MPDMRFEDVPEDSQRAIDEAGQPTLEEVLERTSRRVGGDVSFADAVQAVREDRDRP